MKAEDQEIFELDFLFENAEVYVPKGLDESPIGEVTATVSTLVLHNAPTPELPQEQAAQLMKILNAVGLKDEHVMILQYQEGITFDKEWPFDYVLLFGAELPPFDAKVQKQQYRPFTVLDKKVIFAHGLAELQHNVGMKKQLWEALQLMFGLK